MRKIIFLLLLVMLSVSVCSSFELGKDVLAQASGEEQKEESESKSLFSSSQVLSTKKAFLMSLAIPGTGELYCKSIIKAVSFIGIEALSIGGYAYFIHQYTIKRDDYRAYADSHWIRDVWISWYDSLCALKDTNELGIEKLPSTKTQQYYEMIGKYDWFAFGWDDIIERDDFDSLVQVTYEIAGYTPASDVHDEITARVLSKLYSAHREHYMNMRKEANDKYTVAKYFLGALIFNHIVSAFDAAITAKIHNDKLYKGFTGINRVRFSTRLAVRSGALTPQFLVTIKW